MKKIILIIFSIPFLCYGAYVLFLNASFNPPHSLFDFREGVNPKWAMFIISSLLSIFIGVILLVKGLEQQKKP